MSRMDDYNCQVNNINVQQVKNIKNALVTIKAKNPDAPFVLSMSRI